MNIFYVIPNARSAEESPDTKMRFLAFARNDNYGLQR